MAKRKPNEERVQLSFLREDDLKLYKFMVKESYRCRWDLPTFVLASLQEAFKDRIDEEEEKEVSAIAEEVARKVRERNEKPFAALLESAAANAPEGVDRVDLYTEKGTILASTPVSMEAAMQQAEQQIAALNPPGMKLKRGKIQPPQMPVTK